jgi:hypothetical protein
MTKATGRNRAEKQQQRQNKNLNELTQFPHIIKVKTDLKSLAHEGGMLTVHSPHLIQETQIADVYINGGKNPLYYAEENKQNRKIQTTENNLPEIKLSFQEEKEPEIPEPSHEREVEKISEQDSVEEMIVNGKVFGNPNRFQTVHKKYTHHA